MKTAIEPRESLQTMTYRLKYHFADPVVAAPALIDVLSIRWGRDTGMPPHCDESMGFVVGDQSMFGLENPEC